jgi:cutinase
MLARGHQKILADEEGHADDLDDLFGNQMTQTTTVAFVRALGAVAVLSAALLLVPVGGSVASAERCPDVEVVFARGTAEPPGVGRIGQQFVDALRWRVEPRSFEAYPVNFAALPEFASTVDGVNDASNHIRQTAASCPDTEMVLGGYSRGAALIGYATAPAAPEGYAGVIEPLPPEVATHIAAVVLLGKSSAQFLNSVGAPPPPAISADYAAKTIDLCALGDPICSPGDDEAAHAAYATNGMDLQAADFAAERIGPPETDPVQPL